MNDTHRTADNDPLLRLSVVIPCRNEETRLGRCLAAVLRETAALGSAEVIVVDSASTDGTLAVARTFPVTILQLPAHWPLSPAAGRFIGCRRARGTYIFVIDADMELLPGFLRMGLEFLDKNPRVAGVAGMGREIYDDGGRREDLYDRRWRQQPVSFLGGAAVYRAGVLRSVGNFNPYLRAEEEYEIAQRIRRAGFLLYSLALPMTEHFTSRRFDRFIRRWRAGMFHGIGQMLRLVCEQGMFSVALLFRFRQFACFIGIMTIGAAAVAAALVRGRADILPALPAGIVGIWLLFVMRKGGIMRGTQHFVKYILINIAIGIGLGKKTALPATYPQDASIIPAHWEASNDHPA